jgi:hypothetical protein
MCCTYSIRSLKRKLLVAALYVFVIPFLRAKCELKKFYNEFAGYIFLPANLFTRPLSDTEKSKISPSRCLQLVSNDAILTFMNFYVWSNIRDINHAQIDNRYNRKNQMRTVFPCHTGGDFNFVRLIASKL